MKILKKILFIFLLLFTIYIGDISAGIVDIPEPGLTEIKKVSIEKATSWDIVKDVNSLWFSVLRILKIILQWILLIYIVYIWVSMIISMGTDDDRLSKAKNQLWYSLVALVFINIPWTIYLAIKNDNTTAVDDGTINADDFSSTDANTNIFVNLWLFNDKNWILSDIIAALEVFIFAIAIFVIITAGIKIMTSRWRDEKITEAKWKILYSIFAMIFVGFVDAWTQLAITWDLQFGTSIFGRMIDLSLLFAGPVVIFFLSLAAYYYITSNGDEERVKKAKSIIVNTLIATVLLILMVTFLNDLITLEV